MGRLPTYILYFTTGRLRYDVDKCRVAVVHGVRYFYLLMVRYIRGVKEGKGGVQ